jgi:hypothetical protein
VKGSSAQGTPQPPPRLNVGVVGGTFASGAGGKAKNLDRLTLLLSHSLAAAFIVLFNCTATLFFVPVLCLYLLSLHFTLLARSPRAFRWTIGAFPRSSPPASSASFPTSR